MFNHSPTHSNGGCFLEMDFALVVMVIITLLLQMEDSGRNVEVN